MTETTIASPVSPAARVPFPEALRLWARIGLLSFGGPAGQIALMHRELVERRRWISESRYLHALNYCMLLPGPEAQQLATYVGWLLHRKWGGIAAGVLFVLPGCLAMLLLTVLTAAFLPLDEDPLDQDRERDRARRPRPRLRPRPDHPLRAALTCRSRSNAASSCARTCAPIRCRHRSSS